MTGGDRDEKPRDSKRMQGTSGSGFSDCGGEQPCREGEVYPSWASVNIASLVG